MRMNEKSSTTDDTIFSLIDSTMVSKLRSRRLAPGLQEFPPLVKIEPLGSVKNSKSNGLIQEIKLEPDDDLPLASLIKSECPVQDIKIEVALDLTLGSVWKPKEIVQEIKIEPNDIDSGFVIKSEVPVQEIKTEPKDDFESKGFVEEPSIVDIEDNSLYSGETSEDESLTPYEDAGEYKEEKIGELICARCRHKFRTRTELQEHLLQNFFCRPFVCKNCRRPFTYYKIFVNHVRTCGSDSAPRKRTNRCHWCYLKPQPNLQNHVNRSSYCRPMKCINCDGLFNNFTSLLHHTMCQNHCGICGVVITNYYDLHLQTHQYRPTVKISRSQVKRKTMPNPYSYQCHTCNVVSRFPEDFMSHILSSHIQVISHCDFLCDDCKLVVTNFDALKKHECSD